VATICPPHNLVDLGSCSVDVHARLLDQLHRELQTASVELVQTLLAGDDIASAAALRSGNYEHAADLLYMAAEAESFPEQPLPLPFAISPARDLEDAQLARLVEQTYVGSLDCPRIDGLRRIADVLGGYRAVGQSADSLWKVVIAENSPVGCLFLADHPATNQWEIVYVGLVPAVRGRGWGLELTRHAQWLARQAGRERLVLAVDAANEPAIRHYAAAGFRAWDRKAVWIKSLAVN
jgi:ribosomal protein S18 acetylase RimI-like enzyme